MPKLTDTQLVILSAAVNRKERAVLPLPKSLRINKASAARVLKSLVKHALIVERPVLHDDTVWRESEDGQRSALVITDAGLQALGTEPDEVPNVPATMTKSQPKKASRRAGRKPTTSTPKGKSGASAPASRQGTKQALLIDLLKSKGGATIGEIVEATGWQAHSVRGAISGALKKKLGLTVESETVDDRGRVYRIVSGG